MIRKAERPLSSQPLNRPAEILKGRSAEGVPTVSVDNRARFAGNPAYTDPAVLRYMAAELLQAATYLEREGA